MTDRERFELFREKVILATGVLGVIAAFAAAVLVRPSDPSLLIAIGLASFGLLGVPTTLRADAKRRRDHEQE